MRKINALNAVGASRLSVMALPCAGSECGECNDGKRAEGFRGACGRRYGRDAGVGVCAEPFMPAPFRDLAVTENHELPGAGETVLPGQPLVQPLLRAPLPRPRPRMPYPPTDVTATAAPALASARPALADPATTGRGQLAPQPSSLPAGAGGQIRIINNTAVAVATMSLIPAKGPAGPHALVREPCSVQRDERTPAGGPGLCLRGSRHLCRRLAHCHRQYRSVPRPADQHHGVVRRVTMW